jgi:hypothetical protein
MIATMLSTPATAGCGRVFIAPVCALIAPATNESIENARSIICDHRFYMMCLDDVSRLKDKG